MAGHPDAPDGPAQTLAAVLALALHPVHRALHQNPDAPRIQDVRPSLGEPGHQARWDRCAWDAWDGVHPDEALDVNPARRWSPAFAGADAQKLRGH